DIHRIRPSTRGTDLLHASRGSCSPFSSIPIAATSSPCPTHPCRGRRSRTATRKPSKDGRLTMARTVARSCALVLAILFGAGIAGLAQAQEPKVGDYYV